MSGAPFSLTRRFQELLLVLEEMSRAPPLVLEEMSGAPLGVLVEMSGAPFSFMRRCQELLLV